MARKATPVSQTFQYPDTHDVWYRLPNQAPFGHEEETGRLKSVTPLMVFMTPSLSANETDFMTKSIQIPLLFQGKPSAFDRFLWPEIVAGATLWCVTNADETGTDNARMSFAVRPIRFRFTHLIRPVIWGAISARILVLQHFQ